MCEVKQDHWIHKREKKKKKVGISQSQIEHQPLWVTSQAVHVWQLCFNALDGAHRAAHIFVLAGRKKPQ